MSLILPRGCVGNSGGGRCGEVRPADHLHRPDFLHTGDLEVEVTGAAFAARDGSSLAPVSVDASLHTLSFRATDAAGNVSETGEIVLPGGTLAPAEIQAGGSVDLELQGFEAGDALAIELHSEPVPLATATAGLDGSLSQRVIIPVGSELGLHAVVITGESGRVASLPVVITPADGGIDPGDGGGPGEGAPGNGGAPADPGDGAEAGSLSDTGFPLTPWLLGGAMLCLLGLGLYGVMKRPRRS